MQALYTGLRSRHPHQGSDVDGLPRIAAARLVDFALTQAEAYVPVTLLIAKLVNESWLGGSAAQRTLACNRRCTAQQALNRLIPVGPDIVERLESIQGDIELHTAAMALLDRRTEGGHVSGPLLRLLRLGGDLAVPVIAEGLRINFCRLFHRKVIYSLWHPEQRLEIATAVRRRSQMVRQTDSNWNRLLSYLESGEQE